MCSSAAVADCRAHGHSACRVPVMAPVGSGGYSCTGQSRRRPVDCHHRGGVHDHRHRARHDRRFAAWPGRCGSAGCRGDRRHGRRAGILGELGRGADDLVRRSHRGIRPIQGRKQPDRADDGRAPDRARRATARRGRRWCQHRRRQRRQLRRPGRRLPQGRRSAVFRRQRVVRRCDFPL